MKIYENNYDVEVGRIIYTNNFFKILKQITKENKDVLIITPFTKIKDILNFSKNGGLEQYFTQQELTIENYLNLQSLSEAEEKINKLVFSEILSINLDFQKFLKNIWELSENYVEDLNINNILKFLHTNIIKFPLVVIAGFDEVKVDKNIPHLELINGFVGKVQYQSIEGLLIDQGETLFEVHNIDAFIAWLELKTKTAIDQNMINNFLNNKPDISSYLINNALKEL